MLRTGYEHLFRILDIRFRVPVSGHTVRLRAPGSQVMRRISRVRRSVLGNPLSGFGRQVSGTYRLSASGFCVSATQVRSAFYGSVSGGTIHSFPRSSKVREDRNLIPGARNLMNPEPLKSRIPQPLSPKSSLRTLQGYLAHKKTSPPRTQQ